MKIKILIPIYNDWRSLSELLKNVDQQTYDTSDEISILIVNDGSNEEKENESYKFSLGSNSKAKEQLKLLRFC